MYNVASAIKNKYRNPPCTCMPRINNNGHGHGYVMYCECTQQQCVKKGSRNNKRLSTCYIVHVCMYIQCRYDDEGYIAETIKISAL